MRWEKRPVEIANLLNPAFCAVLLQQTVVSYHAKDPNGMDYLLAFFVLPLLLHPKRRESIPEKTGTMFTTWARRQKDVNHNLVEHVREMAPFTREGLIFAIQQGAIMFSNNNAGNLIPRDKSRRRPNIWPERSTANECTTKAKTVGEWFAEVKDSSVIYGELDIHP